MKVKYAVIAIGLLLFGAWGVLPEAKADDVPQSFTKLADMASPAVVNIRTEKNVPKNSGRAFRQFGQSPFGKDDPFNDFFEKFFGDQGREFKQRSLGSGFIIDKEGYVVTNNHVIDGADKIKVKLNNDAHDEYDAEIVGRDTNTDLALIRLKSAKNLPTLRFGDSDALKVGEWVVAIGSPFGLEHTVTKGIVSAKGRVIGAGPYDDFIQTDASINPGNSGGPLLNMKGEVIGINTMIVASGQGIGFAVPVNLAKNIISQLKSGGEVTRGWLGVAIQDLGPEIAEYYGIKKEQKGVLITEVFPGDPADKAGIRAKDVVIEVNGKKVENARELTRMVADIGVGDTAPVKVLRDGKEMIFKVKIAKREDQKISALNNKPGKEDELGIRVSNMTPEIARRFNLKGKDGEGIIVTGVEDGSKAEEAGIQVGDLIKEVDRVSVSTVEEYEQAVDKIKKGDTVQFLIRRANSAFMVIKVTK
jgi:serine protease Do